MARKKGNEYNYDDADRYFGVNVGDPDLKPIFISLPTPPKEELIAGYGLHPNEQFFKRENYPYKLKSLEERVYRELKDRNNKNEQVAITGAKILNLFWDILENESDYYTNEIDWMGRVIWHTIHGYWFYNKGKPTYICGWHYELLNFWYNPDLPHLGYYFEYRDRDRRKLLFDYYCYTAKETFKDLDDNNVAIKNEHGLYNMLKTISRICYGSIKLKNRRSGETHQGLLEVWAIIRKSIGGHATIISKDGSNAKSHFKDKFIPAWQRYPLFLKPMWDGTNDPNKLELKAPSNDFMSPSLNSSFFVTDSADETKNDGLKLVASLNDEQAKVAMKGVKVDVYKRWNINKLTMSQGDDIHGFCTNPSTVEEMSHGGEVYINMFDSSNFYQRMPSGQTKTGLFGLYTPAQDGYQGYIDPWGNSVIKNPSRRLIEETLEYCKANNVPESQFKYISGKGAFVSLEADRNALLKENTPRSLKLYREMVRKQPMKFADCLSGSSGDLDLPMEIIVKRMVEIRNKKPSIGYFQWKNGMIDGEVEWVEDPETGYIERYDEVPRGFRNQRQVELMFNTDTYEEEDSYRPMFPDKYTCGVDSFEYSDDLVATKGTSKSDGSFTMLKHGDNAYTQATEYNKWKGFKTMFSCRYRESQEKFDEQVLMACVYAGALLYPERNKTSTWRHFVKRGYRGYLKYDINPNTGKPVDKPGYYVGDKSELFTLLDDYLTYNGANEDCYELLKECRDIKSVKQLTKFDRLAGFLAALKGVESSYGKAISDFNDDSLDLGVIFKHFS